MGELADWMSLSFIGFIAGCLASVRDLNNGVVSTEEKKENLHPIQPREAVKMMKVTN